LKSPKVLRVYHRYIIDKIAVCCIGRTANNQRTENAAGPVDTRQRRQRRDVVAKGCRHRFEFVLLQLVFADGVLLLVCDESHLLRSACLQLHDECSIFLERQLQTLFERHIARRRKSQSVSTRLYTRQGQLTVLEVRFEFGLGKNRRTELDCLASIGLYAQRSTPCTIDCEQRCQQEPICQIPCAHRIASYGV